ncbi:DUF975 family protein [Limosilactobacillus caccae]|uniref:DUF975 family protein n=1 Tax=Limosilactobacillus caccae TaxID=1926284 RepID=UPI000970B678|nr:DUF975 family protein [Limosilactobacillus caccae]
MTRAELKNKAKQNLRGNWGWSVGIALVYEALAIMLHFAEDNGTGLIIVAIYSIIVGMISISWEYTSLALADGDTDNANFAGILASVRADRFKVSFIMMVLMWVYLTLWTLLLIIPGIIKIFSYSQTSFIIKDKLDSGQQISANEAITESRKLMDGHKAEYFILQLSFLGWVLLGILTIGIANLWVFPYIYTTNANYYRQLAGDRYRGGDAEDDNQQDDVTATFEEK